jgi:HEAT repeat protein
VAAAAFRGLLTAQPAETIALLLQGLGSDMQWKRAVAADYLTELKQPDQVEAIATRLAELPPAGQIAAFVSLRSRRDTAVREAAIGALEHADADVCVAALGALIQNATAEDVPLLIRPLTTAEPSEVRAAAFETLRRMPAAGTNEALRQWMDASEDLPAVVVRCAGARRSPLLVPVLLKAAGASEQAARLEAFNALEIMATHEHAAELVTLLCHSQPGEEREAADRAVWMSCQQISDPTQRTAPLLKALEQADAAAQCAILPALGRMGGEAALAAVQNAMQSEEPAVRDAGYRALANWPDASVADQLLEISRTHQVESYRIWSLRAYARVVALASERDPLETYRLLDEAMGLATRVEDKRLFVERLAAVRVPEALTRLLSLLDDPDLKETAVAATFTLAKGLSQSHPDQAREALEKILPLTTDPVLQQQIPKVLRDMGSPNAQPQN